MCTDVNPPRELLSRDSPFATDTPAQHTHTVVLGLNDSMTQKITCPEDTRIILSLPMLGTLVIVGLVWVSEVWITAI